MQNAGKNADNIDDLVEKLKEKSIKLLARREQSRNELLIKLTVYARSFDYKIDSVVEKRISLLLDWLLIKNWQSDERFCEVMINNKNQQGKGEVAIKHFLQQHDINADLIHKVMPQTINNKQQYELANSELLKKFNSLQNDTLKLKAKKIRFLQQRGFSYNIIYKLVGSVNDSC